MREHTGGEIGKVWVAAAIVFTASVYLVRAAESQRAGLTIGYVGLAALGAALWFTWRWLQRGGPSAGPVHMALKILVATAMVLWFVALVFPFL